VKYGVICKAVMAKLEEMGDHVVFGSGYGTVTGNWKSRDVSKHSQQKLPKCLSMWRILAMKVRVSKSLPNNM
jgi:hypothetical protein